MSWISAFFASDGQMHQVVRSGELINDLTTGRTGFVVSDSDGFAMVADERGRLHQLLKNGAMTTDLTTGTTYFEI